MRRRLRTTLRPVRRWLRDRLVPARARCERAVDERPWDLDAHRALSDVLRAAADWEALERAAERGLEVDPEDDVLHKARLDAIVASIGLDGARTRFGLTRRQGPVAPDAGVIACSVVRNEADRLEAFLDECGRLGVAHHIVIDNGSTDGTSPILAGRPDIEVWSASTSFRAANFGATWFDLVVRDRFEGRWLLLLDADETLCYVDVEHQPISEFCARLDAVDARAAAGVLIDCYSDHPLVEVDLTADRHPIEVLGYFDRMPYSTRTPHAGPFGDQVLYEGGVRQRVFGGTQSYWLTKTPLVRYDPSMPLVGGQHFAAVEPSAIAELGCAVLHTKFTSGFVAAVHAEAARGEHSGEGAQYRRYAEVLDADPALTLFDPDHSVRYAGSSQLVELGLLRPVG